MRIFLNDEEIELLTTALDHMKWRIDWELESVHNKPASGHLFAGRFCLSRMAKVREKLNPPTT